MFREKEWLINQGLYPQSRNDVCYIIGSVYDDVVNNNGIVTQDIIDKIEQLRAYINEHRDIITDKDYSIVLTKSVLRRLEELGFSIKKEKKVRENYSSDKKENWKNHGGVYAICLNDKIVYIGSTNNFGKRFLEHEYGIYKNPSQYVHKKLHEYIGLSDYQISFKVLIDIDAEPNHKFSDKELRAIEYGLIKVYQPTLNCAGITSSFY